MFNRHPARAMLCTVLMIGLLVASCVPATTPTPSPVSAPTATLAPATANRVIVTLTPLPTASPVPTATLPFDVTGLLGRWVISLEYKIVGNPTVAEVRYVGILELQVKGDATLTGNGMWQASANHPPCAASVADELPLEAAVSGTLSAQEDGSVRADIRLIPAIPLQTTTVSILCSAGAQPTQHTLALLWPALQVTNGPQFSVPLRRGYSATFSVDLSGPSAGGLHGSLTTQILVSR